MQTALSFPLSLGGYPLLPTFTFPASHPPTHQHRYKSRLRHCDPLSQLLVFVVFVPHSFTHALFSPNRLHLSTRSSTIPSRLDTNIIFTLLLQISSLARFTHGSQRFVVLQGPQFVRLTPYLGTRRHRLPRHRPDFILIPAPDGMCLPPPIAAIH